MARAVIIGITLLFAGSVSGQGPPPKFPESVEPPLADGMVQQAGAQIGIRPPNAANSYATPVVTVTVIAPHVSIVRSDPSCTMRALPISTV